MTKLKKVILAGLLTAASIVLNRFLSIRTPISTLGFAFAASALAAMLLGVWWSMFVCGVADVIGALLFPSGAFFPGYTLTAVVTGLIYGLLLGGARKMSWKKFIVRTVAAYVLVAVVCTMGLNTLWSWITTKKAIVAIISTRALMNVGVMLPIRIAVTLGLQLALTKGGIYRRLFNEEEPDSEVESGTTVELQPATAAESQSATAAEAQTQPATTAKPQPAAEFNESTANTTAESDTTTSNNLVSNGQFASSSKPSSSAKTSGRTASNKNQKQGTKGTTKSAKNAKTNKNSSKNMKKIGKN